MKNQEINSIMNFILDNSIYQETKEILDMFIEFWIYVVIHNTYLGDLSFQEIEINGLTFKLNCN